MRNWICRAALGVAVTAAALPATTQAREWNLELTPYIWAAGIDADIKAGGREVSTNKSFSDILDNVKLGANILAIAQMDRWVTLAQIDYLSHETSDFGSIPARAETDFTLITVGAGYQFDGWSEGQTFDVMVGARYLRLENDLFITDVGSAKSDKDLLDPLLMLRPSLPLSARWRFNPTLSVGIAGDSEKTWELQPQFQYEMSNRWALRFGYRNLNYDVKGEQNQFRWDGSLSGLFIGIGGLLGG